MNCAATGGTSGLGCNRDAAVGGRGGLAAGGCGGAAAVSLGPAVSGARGMLAAYFDSRASSYKPSHPMQQKVNSALVDMQMSALCAESLVANDELRTLIVTLDPRTGVISRHGVSREVHNRFVALVARLKRELFDTAILHMLLGVV
jgi:hypothetical protein